MSSSLSSSASSSKYISYPESDMNKSITTFRIYLQNNPENMTERECWGKTKMAALIDLLAMKSIDYNINQNSKITLLESKIAINDNLTELDNARKSDPASTRIKELSKTLKLQYHFLIEQIEGFVNKEPTSPSDDNVLKIRTETIIALEEVIDKSTDILNLIVDFKEKVLECNFALYNDVVFNENFTRLSNTATQLNDSHRLYIISIKARYYSLWEQKLSSYDLSSKSQQLYNSCIETQRDNFLKKDLRKSINSFSSEFMKSRKNMIFNILDSWRRI